MLRSIPPDVNYENCSERIFFKKQK
jgi:hypothetical protein